MTAGLLATNAPFGFVALLGAMRLAGMMVKNAIVLLHEVNANFPLERRRARRLGWNGTGESRADRGRLTLGYGHQGVPLFFPCESRVSQRWP